jgi:S1-C subfamily serine protease
LSKTEPLVGEAIWVAGAPKGFQGTLSTGIVSAYRDAGYLGFKSYQINAAISPGSSGGPVMNSEGAIVGVSVASYTDGQALNFAIPAYYVEDLLKP